MSNEREALESIWSLWTSHRREEIPPAVEGDGSPTDVLRKYLSLQGDLFWEKRDLSAVLSLTGSARDYCRAVENPEAENVLLFNTASFTLPWWSDAPAATPWQREQGRGAARLLPPLREALRKGPADLSQAWWVLGAHELYFGNAPQAIDALNRALTHAREARDKNLEACALEGLGRTRVRLVPGERDWGFESLGEARVLYAEASDAYNLKELESFLGGPPA